MNNEDFNLRIRFAYSKGRNIIYYRTLDQQLRPRATYIHVLRDYRKYLIELLSILPDTIEYKEPKEFFLGIVRLINPKVTTEECTQTIINMSEYYEQRK